MISHQGGGKLIVPFKMSPLIDCLLKKKIVGKSASPFIHMGCPFNPHVKRIGLKINLFKWVTVFKAQLTYFLLINGLIRHIYLILRALTAYIIFFALEMSLFLIYPNNQMIKKHNRMTWHGMA